VVATALALLDVSGRQIPRNRLAALLALGERYVGLQGGGMDQAICLGGRAGHALRIDFRPELTLVPVPVPPHWRIVVASSLVEAAKSARAREGYNTRVAECRAALEQVTVQGLGFAAPADYAALLARLPAEAALEAARRVLDPTLLQRFRHVITEAVRVGAAEAALRRNDLTAFGALLHASHASLRDDYGVSTPELDRLVEIAEAAGAVGARLTGAGFGGCILAAVSAQSAEGVIEALRREYFAPRGLTRTEEVLFIAVPSEGAHYEDGRTV
jgi:galactokinase